MRLSLHKIGIAVSAALLCISLTTPALAAPPINRGLLNALSKHFKHQTQQLNVEVKEDQKSEGDAKDDSSASIAVFPRFELVQGTIASMSSTATPATLVVTVSQSWPAIASSSLSVQVDANTIINRQYWGKSDLSQLNVGDAVQVFGQLNDPSTLHALFIKDNSIVSDTHVGVINSIDVNAQTFVLRANANASTTADLTVHATDQTKITDRAGNVLSFGALNVGDSVRVIGILDTQSNSVLAQSIRDASQPASVLPFSFSGSLTAISSTNVPSVLSVKVTNIKPPLRASTSQVHSLQADTIDIHVDANTKLERRGGAAMTLSDLSIGDSLRINARLNTDGTMTATLVRDESLGAMGSTLSGTIASIQSSDNTFVINTTSSGSYTVQVNASLLPDFSVGEHVNIQGTLDNQTRVIQPSRIAIVFTF